MISLACSKFPQGLCNLVRATHHCDQKNKEAVRSIEQQIIHLFPSMSGRYFDGGKTLFSYRIDNTTNNHSSFNVMGHMINDTDTVCLPKR